MSKLNFGKSPDGTYCGGGKPTAGGFVIPAGLPSGDDDDEESGQLRWRTAASQTKPKLLDERGIKPNQNHLS